MSRYILLAFCIAAAASGQAPAKKQARPAKKQAEAAPAPLNRKSALDKLTLEAYLRHAMGWFPPVNIEIGDAKPAEGLPGLLEVKVRASYREASQEETFLVSKDGRKVLRAPLVYDINNNPFKPELDKLTTQLQPSMGTPGAPVVLVVFTDFECPFCKEEARMLRQELLKAYPKQVRLYFKDLPLEQLHPWAKTAAIAGRCIFRQNAAAFWEYHDWIYASQAKITPDNFKNEVLGWAKDKEIDTLQLARCLDTRSTEAEVDKSIAEARSLKVQSTPTIFVNGRPVVGQMPWPQLKQIIDYEIEYQKTARNAGEDCGCEVKLPAPGIGSGPSSSSQKPLLPAAR